MLNREYLLQCSIAIMDFLNEKTDPYAKEKIMNRILKKHHFELMSFTKYVSNVRNINHKIKLYEDFFKESKQFYTQLIRELKIELYEME